MILAISNGGKISTSHCGLLNSASSSISSNFERSRPFSMWSVAGLGAGCSSSALLFSATKWNNQSFAS